MGNTQDDVLVRMLPTFEEIERRVLGGVHGVQKLHELVTDLGRGFVLCPMAHVVEYETPHETRKSGAELVHG